MEVRVFWLSFVGYPKSFSAVEFLKFETGHEVYKPLESMRFAGSQRFVYLDGVRTGVEARISQVVSGTGDV